MARTFKGTVLLLGKYTYSNSCQELDEEVDTSHITESGINLPM